MTIKAINVRNQFKGTIKEINWKTGKIKIFNDTNKKTISVDLKKTHSFNEKPFHFDDFVKNDLEGLFIASAPSILSTHIVLPNEPMAKISVLNVGISPDKNLIVTGNKKFIDKFNTLCDTLNDLKVIVDTTSTTDDALHTLICEHAQLDPETEMILQSVIMHSDDLPLESHDEAAELNEGTVEQQEVDIIDEEAEDTEEEISAGETLPYGCSKPYALDIHIYHPLKNSEINRRHITLKGNAPANTRIWLCHNGWKEKKIHFFALTTSDSEGKWKASLTVKNGDHKIAAGRIVKAADFARGDKIVSVAPQLARGGGQRLAGAQRLDDGVAEGQRFGQGLRLALQRHRALVQRQAVEARAVQRGEGLQPVQRRAGRGRHVETRRAV